MLHDDEVVPRPLLIAQEQIFAVRRVDVGPVFLGFLDGRYRWMLVPRDRDAELLKTGDDTLFLRGHNVTTAAP